MIDADEILDAPEAASFLRMTRARVVRLANKDAIPHVRLPDGEARFLKADLLAWVRAQRKGPAVEGVSDA